MKVAMSLVKHTNTNSVMRLVQDCGYWISFPRKVKSVISVNSYTETFSDSVSHCLTVNVS